MIGGKACNPADPATVRGDPPGSSSASVSSSQQKFCDTLTGAGGATVFAQAASTGNGATALSKSLQKLAKTTSSKSLKSSLTTLASFYKRLGKGERMLSGIESTCADLCRFACGLMPRGWKRETAKQKTEPGAGPAAAPSA